MPPPVPPKIYLATCKPGKFAFLSSCTIVSDPSEADFVVVDLADPLATPDWICQSAQVVRPMILTALGGSVHPGTIAIIGPLYGKVPPIYQNDADVDHAVAWAKASLDAMKAQANAMLIGQLRLAG